MSNVIYLRDPGAAALDKGIGGAINTLADAWASNIQKKKQDEKLAAENERSRVNYNAEMYKDRPQVDFGVDFMPKFNTNQFELPQSLALFNNGSVNTNPAYANQVNTDNARWNAEDQAKQAGLHADSEALRAVIAQRSADYDAADLPGWLGQDKAAYQSGKHISNELDRKTLAKNSADYEALQAAIAQREKSYLPVGDYRGVAAPVPVPDKSLDSLFAQEAYDKKNNFFNPYNYGTTPQDAQQAMALHQAKAAQDQAVAQQANYAAFYDLIGDKNISTAKKVAVAHQLGMKTSDFEALNNLINPKANEQYKTVGKNLYLIKDGNLTKMTDNPETSGSVRGGNNGTNTSSGTKQNGISFSEYERALNLLDIRSDNAAAQRIVSQYEGGGNVPSTDDSDLNADLSFGFGNKKKYGW